MKCNNLIQLRKAFIIITVKNLKNTIKIDMAKTSTLFIDQILIINLFIKQSIPMKRPLERMDRTIDLYPDGTHVRDEFVKTS